MIYRNVYKSFIQVSFAFLASFHSCVLCELRYRAYYINTDHSTCVLINKKVVTET